MRIIYQPHPLLFEREKKKMNLTPVSEVGSAIEHEEEYNTGAEKIEGREVNDQHRNAVLYLLLNY